MNKDQQPPQVNEGIKIAKIVLYICVFLVLVRCDMWISLIVLMMVGFYMLQIRLLNKFLSSAQNRTGKLAATGQALMKQWFETHVNETKGKQTTSSKLAIKPDEPDLRDVDMTSELPESFQDDSFADIWQDYHDSSEEHD